MAGSSARPPSGHRRGGPWWRRTWIIGALIAVAIGSVAEGVLCVWPAAAQVFNPQWVGIPKPIPAPPGEPGLFSTKRDPNAQMLVQASEIHYDYTNSRVSAIGNVQIYYNGSTLEADSVI